MKGIPWRLLALVLFLVSLGCSTPSGPAGPKAAAAPRTPTPSLLKRVNPNIVEEDEVHFVERFPKSEYIRVDARHIGHPLIPNLPVEFFKEDENYYYVYTYKRLPEEMALRREALEKTKAAGTPSVPPGVTPTPGVSPADFTDILPPRVAGRLRLEEVASSGLPRSGMWRASFVIADMNGDGIPDIVAPPARGGGTRPQVWIGDGHGKFTWWPLTFTEGGKPLLYFGATYGGMAVGDIDGDGHLDMVLASHGGGLVSLFGDGKGRFEVVRKGLPDRDFSAQAVALVNAGGDGKLDIVASRDIVEQDTGTVDTHQVRVYLYRGSKGWEYKPDGLVGGFYSYSLHAWDYNGDGKLDVLTGSHYLGALTLLWKNEGNGMFSRVSFPAIEIYAHHFATVPGTFGKERVPAFADAYQMFTNDPAPVRAVGITVYSFKDGDWTRHRVWRKKEGNPYQYPLAMGDLDGDGLDDIVFPDSEAKRLRVFFQQPDGSFRELAESEEPRLDSPGQCVRLVDLDGDGRLDIVLAKTISSNSPNDPGGWDIYMNRSVKAANK